MEFISFDLETNEPAAGSVPDGENIPGWELVAPGRYRPRRTRGSFPGRELG